MEAACQASYFANGITTGMEIPVDEAQAKIYWDERLAKARQFAGTSHLLFMNGCDHQPVQKNLPEAIAVAKSFILILNLFILI